jgi:hypothetical protein
MAGVIISGDTSGSVTLQAPAVAGSTTLTLPATSGTILQSGTVVTEAQGGNGTTTGYYGFKSRIINGGMVIDQRNAGASVSVSTSTTTYITDRFNVRYTTGSGLTAQQSSTAPSGFSKSLLITVGTGASASASDNNRLVHFVEGFNSADLAFGTASAVTVTLSFWVRSSLTGTFSVCLQNEAGDRSYISTYTINSANTWEQKFVTVAGDTTGTWVGATNAIGITVMWDLGSGSSYDGTAGSWPTSGARRTSGSVRLVGTSGATFYITGVQFEKGSTATSFDYRPYGTELQLCQRYFQTFVKGANASFGVGFYYSGTTYHQPIRFQQQMRTSPSLVITTGTDYYKVEKNGGNDNLNGFLLARNNEWGGLIYNDTEASGTSGQAWESVTLNASAYIGFSAEL